MSLARYRIVRAVGVAVISLLGVVTPAWAADPTTVELKTEQEVALGDAITVWVAVRDSRGDPVNQAIVVLLTPASFGDTSGEMRLGQITTDALGQATFTYQARREGPQTFIARFIGDSNYVPAEASVALSVQGSVQLYEQQAGVKIPGLGVWLLVLLLGGFWSVYLVVMVLVTRIAIEGKEGTLDIRRQT